MRAVTSFAALEKLGRVRLSRHFFVRDFLYSEIGNFHGIPNLPENPDLLIAAGTRLALDLLDPLVETFGPIAVRSSYRSPAVNGFGNVHGLSCAKNAANYAGHIWDRRDGAGRMGACACIVVPWFADQYDHGRDWRDFAWWVHDHLPYHDMFFFPKRAAFNLTWREDPVQRIASYIAPKGLIRLEDIEQRRLRYADFPAFRGIAYPAVPTQA